MFLLVLVDPNGSQERNVRQTKLEMIYNKRWNEPKRNETTRYQKLNKNVPVPNLGHPNSMEFGTITD